MKLTESQKKEIKSELVKCLRSEFEISKIIVFGSFLTSKSPEDLDVAVFLNSTENYYSLVPRLRSKIRHIISKIPVDLIPVQENIAESFFLSEINAGELIYER